MATPENQEADEARGYFSRERRRHKQDQKDYGIAGYAPAPFIILGLAVNAGGAGYAAGDQFAVNGGTFAIQGRGYVVTEVAGVATVVAVSNPGKYSVVPGPGSTTTNITGTGVGLTVDPTMSGLFDFGDVLAGGQSANGLILPAAGEFALVHSAATVAGDMGILDQTTNIPYPSADPGQAGGRVNIRRKFPEVHEIFVIRGITGPAGAVDVFFRGPKSQLVQIGEANFL